MKILFLLSALALTTGLVSAEEKKDVVVEQTTESPIADMALVGDALKADKLNADKETIKQLPGNSQPHTIADFIIHPLIALKPRVAETPNAKQADGSSTTASPWQLFGFNAGQGLGSSVSSLAGSVTGWLGNRIQLPGLLDTSVREPSTTSTTTTTSRPDIVVRLQQRPSTRKPLISINNKNERPFRRYKKPNRFNYVNYEDDSSENDDSWEYNEYENFADKRKNRRRYQNYEEEDDDVEPTATYEINEYYEDGEENGEQDDGHNSDEEHEDVEEEEEEDERPFKTQNVNQKNRPRTGTLNTKQQHPLHQRRQTNHSQQRKTHSQQEESAEEEDEDDDQAFYYNTNQETKRSQNELDFIKYGQQNLLKQIKQFTGGQTPAEIGNTLNKAQKTNKRLQQATLLVKRNGQTVYVAPELLQIPLVKQQKFKASTNKSISYHYPQPPLAMSSPKRRVQPTQYITIPWNQLGISPPNQIVSLAEGMQSQPLILSIPQGAIQNMQKFGNKNKKPSLTADAVPLLAEASIMDVFKPPRMPAARTPTKKPAVVIATKNRIGPARIRPATVVEKSPAVADIKKHEGKKTSPQSSKNDKSPQFLVIADEPSNNKLSRNAYRQILDYFNQNRSGRQLNDEEAFTSPIVAETKEQLIPVKIITGNEESVKTQDEIKYELNSTTESSIVLESPKMKRESEANNKADQMEPVTETKTAS